jgi:hypothetical protein
MAVSRLVGRGMSLHEPPERPVGFAVPCRPVGAARVREIPFPDPVPRIERPSPGGTSDCSDEPPGSAATRTVSSRTGGERSPARLPAGCGALGPTRVACRGSLTPRCDASRAATLTRIVERRFSRPFVSGGPA